MILNVTKIRYAIVIAASACMVPGSASAGDDDPLKFVLSETLTHDDNVFRTSGSFVPVADTITSTSAGVTLDTYLSRQHLQAGVSETDNRYKRISAFNNSGLNYQLGWQGTFPDRWTTAASWTRSESLANYADLRNISDKDIVTGETASFRLGYLPHPDCPIYVQVANGNSSNSLVALAGNDLKTNSAEVGLQYNFPLGNQASVLVRKTDGRNPNGNILVDNNYHQDDIQAAIQWKPGSKSALSFRVGETRREQDGLPQGNFSGATGNLSFDWALTSITSINATMGRDITPITAITAQYFNLANYALVRSYGLSARWAPTSKISAEARINRLSRVFGGVPTDTTTASTLILQYAPLRSVQISMQLKHEVRESNDPTLPYTSNVGTLSATLSF